MIATVNLHKDVVGELAFDPSVDERAIAVAVDGGIVTLTGSVPSYSHKIAAEKAVKRVRGVQAIAEELTVDLPVLHHRNDTDLAKAAVQALHGNTTVPDNAVQVEVENGRVTLSGTVDWQYQRNGARYAVASLPGVSGVLNAIALRPRVSAGDIKAKIRESFRRNAEIDANQVQIEASGSTVTLRGPVHSWMERDEATSAAYSVAGVTNVHNLTTVS